MGFPFFAHPRNTYWRKYLPVVVAGGRARGSEGGRALAGVRSLVVVVTLVGEASSEAGVGEVESWNCKERSVNTESIKKAPLTYEG